MNQHLSVLENKFRSLFVDLPTDEPDLQGFRRIGIIERGLRVKGELINFSIAEKVGVDLPAEFSR